MGHFKESQRGQIDPQGFDDVLFEFPQEFERVKPLCKKLRSILFPLKDGAIFTGTPKDPNILYGPILEAFNEVINELNKEACVPGCLEREKKKTLFTC